MQNSYAAFVRHGAAGPLRSPAAQRWVLICLKRLCLPARLLLRPRGPARRCPRTASMAAPGKRRGQRGGPPQWSGHKCQLHARVMRRRLQKQRREHEGRCGAHCPCSNHLKPSMKAPTYPDKPVYSRTGPNL